MATDRDQIELTFEGMTARVGRFLSRVYRFPHDWGVPEPKPTDNGDAFLRKRLEELRIYGCSPVPSSRLLGPNSSASGAGRPAPSPCSDSANTKVREGDSERDRATGECPPHRSRERQRTGVRSEKINPHPRLFRYDAKRLKRLIASAEHMIRCLIIWRAYRAMRDEDIKPRYHFIPIRLLDCCSSASGFGQSAPSRCSCARCTPKSAPSPPHPNFAVRGLPLYEPKAPAFRISMPLELDRSSLRRQGPRRDEPDSRLRGNERNLVWGGSPERVLCDAQLRENKGKRPRNDDLGTHDRLYLRLERLDQLYDEIDKRGRRLAARWAGEIYGPDIQDRREDEASDPPPAPPFLGREQPETASLIVQQGFSPLKRGLGRNGNWSQFPDQGPQDRGGSNGGSPLLHEQSEGADALSRRRRNASSIRPLKSHDPPPGLLENADEAEAEDLHILHDVAIRTAGEFHLLCG